MKILKSILNFRMFHPAQWFVERDSKINSQVLNPPSWRERQVQNQMIERQYEESLRVEPKDKEPSWTEKYK